MRTRAITAIACLLISILLVGCAAIPDIRSQPQFHNPFPQLHRIAVLPFTNQSQERTLDTDTVTIAYHNELQKLPGFEVKPLGVVRTQMQAMGIELSETTDFQALAQHLDVDVVVLGAVTEYTPYYPPRMGMRVHWYSANPGFHPIPPGYGLPWGTAEEEYIPDRLVHEAEFALAREQLKTQTPDYVKAPLPARTIRPRRDSETDDESKAAPMSEGPMQTAPPASANEEEIPRPDLNQPPGDMSDPRNAKRVSHQGNNQWHSQDGATRGVRHAVGGDSVANSITAGGYQDPFCPQTSSAPDPRQYAMAPAQALPPDWPDPLGFLPEGPSPMRRPLIPQSEPVISHTRLYDGNDEEFTQQVSEYFYFRDDARFGGWQAYLQRSEDFIRVCCYLHVTETLAARGGAGKSRVVWRWPIGRYER